MSLLRASLACVVVALVACSSFTGTAAPADGDVGAPTPDGGIDPDAADAQTPSSDSATTPTGPQLVQAASAKDHGGAYDIRFDGTKLTKPKSGDVLVFVIALNDSTAVPGGPADWSVVESSTVNAPIYAWTRVADGFEEQVAGATHGANESTGTSFQMFVAEWSGVGPFVGSAATVTTDSGGSPDINPQVVIISSPVIVIGFGSSTSAQAPTPSAPYATIGADASGADISLFGAWSAHPAGESSAPMWHLAGNPPGWDAIVFSLPIAK